MRLQKIVLIFPLLIAVFAYAASIPQSNSQLVPEARISRNVNYTFSSLPVPRPNQTIGDYFDRLLSENQSTLNERAVYHTKTLTEATWTDGTINFNISMSRCVTMSDKAGIYTAKTGNLYNATVQDIVTDLQAREGSEAANRVEYSSRVEENAQLTIDAANDLLKAAVVDYTPTTLTTNSNTHDEFRHLLALAEYVVLIFSASLLAEISVAFSANVTGRANGVVPDTSIAVFAITSYALHMAVDIQNLARGRRINFVQATLFNIFLSWVRDAVRVFAGEFLPEGKPSFLPSVSYDRVVNGKGNPTRGGTLLDGTKWPLAQNVVDNAVGKLGYVEQPLGRFVAASAFRGGGHCPKP